MRVSPNATDASPTPHSRSTLLFDIRDPRDAETIIPRGKTQTRGDPVLPKRTAPPIEQIIINPAERYVFFKTKNRTNAALALYVPSGTMKERRIE